ncbi:unnamed protein product [Closterium sp. NIES-65]|nr:unnamed protein product [Closterium sp. NIES-65]
MEEGSEGQPPGGAGTNEEVQSEDGSDWESDFDDGDSTESDDDDSAVDENDFNTALEFFRFVIGCNGGQGLSDEATVWLFKLLRDPRLDLEAIRRWRTKHAVLQYGLRLMMARRVYRQVEVRIPGIDHTFELMCTSPIEGVVEIFGHRDNADGFQLFARPVHSVAGRVYTRPETGLLWEAAQNALDEIYGPGQVVAPIILSSDAMILSGNERVKVWAVYLSIANIHLRLRWGDSGKILLALLPMPVHGMTAEQKVQLFQAAMQVVLADLIAASHTRQNALHPGARQAGLLTPGDASYWVSGANFTASEHAAVMMVRPYLLVYALVRVPNGRDGCQMAFADYALPVWQIVPFVLEGEVAVICSRTIVAFLDWHETFVRAAEHTDESLSAFDTATRRMVQLVESTFPREHSGWNLVKVHLLLHLTEAIRRGGLPREYSAAVYENAHIRTCKRPYRQSNHRDVGRVIAQHNTNAALLTRIPTNLEGNRQYNTAMRRAIASGLPQLCRQRSRMHSAITDREQAPLDLYATFDAAIPGGIGPYAYLTRLFGYVSFPAWVHTALALPARGTDHGLIRPHYVRANPSHHGAATFSFIEYEDGTGETVVGRVHLLLTLMMNSEDAHPAGEAVAFVRQWYPYLEDECTGCMRMRPSDDELSYNLVPVASVQRTVHMVESFVTPGLWYLNRWAGRCREELP